MGLKLLEKKYDTMNTFASSEASGIWPLDPMKMDDEMAPSECWPSKQVSDERVEVAMISIEEIKGDV